MADPEISVPRLPAEYMKEALSQFTRLVESVCNDIYGLGFTHGDAAAMARILKAVQSSANGQAVAAGSSRTARTPQTSADKTPGAATHKLIEAVLRSTSSGKASPSDIRKSPLNRDGIARDAIRNALRRGKDRYVSDGKGSYSLKKTEAPK
jgi:hypothetical protein